MDKNLYIDPEKEKLKKASVMLFGAGTQSIGLLLMCLEGVFEKPDCVVFADVGDEPDHVYEYLDMFEDYIWNRYNFKIITVRRVVNVPILDEVGIPVAYSPERKSLSQSIIDYLDGVSNEKPKSLPYRTENGLLRYRQCTDHFKIRPCQKFMRQEYKPDKKSTIEQWFGISYDEISRMRISQKSWLYNRYPLIEMELSRMDTIKYVKRHGLPQPPRSSCYFCPFHSDKYWNFLKTEHPKDFQKAIELDEKIRFFPGFNQKLYLNKNGKTPKPLKDFEYVEQQGLFPELIDECEGYCGV